MRRSPCCPARTPARPCTRSSPGRPSSGPRALWRWLTWTATAGTRTDPRAPRSLPASRPPAHPLPPPPPRILFTSLCPKMLCSSSPARMITSLRHKCVS